MWADMARARSRLKMAAGWENTNGYIGIYSGASGTVKVNGTDSTWENDGDLYIGGWSTHRGSADVLIQGGGTLSVTGDTKVYSGSTISLNRGTLRTSTLSAMGWHNRRQTAIQIPAS